MDARAPEQEAGEQVHSLRLRHPRGGRGEVLRHGAVEVQQVEPLGQVGDPPVGPPDLAARGFEVAADHAEQGGLAGAVGAGQSDPLGPPDRQVGAFPGEQGPLAVADLHPLAEKDRAPGRDVGRGQFQRDLLLVAQGAARLVQPCLRVAEPRRVRLVRLPRRLLGAPLQPSGDDLRQAGVLEVAGGVAGPARGALAGLLHLPLLPPDLLLGVADVLLGDLPRGAHGLLVLGEVPAVRADLTPVELGDAVHAVEQCPVVADQQQTAVPVLEHAVELVPRVEVEVVGRFVEQQHVGPLQQLCRQTEGDDLAAAEGAQTPGEGEVSETEPVELGTGALLDVPVVADGGEVLLARVSGLDGVQCPDHRGDPQDLGHGQVAGQRQRLGQVARHPLREDRAGGRAELPGDQPEQRALAGAVGRHQAGVPGWDGEREVLEHRGVVGPGKGQVGDHDEGVGHRIASAFGRYGEGRPAKWSGYEDIANRRSRDGRVTDGHGIRDHPEMSSSPAMSCSVPATTASHRTSSSPRVHSPMCRGPPPSIHAMHRKVSWNQTALRVCRRVRCPSVLPGSGSRAGPRARSRLRLGGRGTE